MGLEYTDHAFRVMQDLKQKCQLLRGTFALLWHNSELQNEKQINMFKEIIKSQNLCADY
jgi:hypothetical protein